MWLPGGVGGTMLDEGGAVPGVYLPTNQLGTQPRSPDSSRIAYVGSNQSREQHHSFPILRMTSDCIA